MEHLLNKIHLADCMNIMKDISNKYIDLAIVDPPYGINRSGGRMGGDKLVVCKDYHKFDDSDSPDKKYFEELFRISKNQIIWGANHFISKIPYDSPCWLIWYKKNGNSNFADVELAWGSFKSAARIFKFRWAGMLQENMKEKEIRIHPTQKPIALYRWLLQNYAKKDDLIFDSHSGSGSLACACIEEGFNFIVCELEEDYYKASIERLSHYKDQGKLF